MDYNKYDRYDEYDFADYDRWDKTAEVEQSILLNSLNINMNNSRLSWTNVKNALSMGVVFGVVALIGLFLKAGTFFGVDYHTMVNVFGLAFLGFVGSVLQSLLTSPSTGNFVGTMKIK